jgi:hypothetical protein
MQPRLAHRVGRSSQATTAAVDKSIERLAHRNPDAPHNIINTGTVPLKLYTLYAPPNHRDGVVHLTRGDAEADSEHFDGKTTE